METLTAKTWKAKSSAVRAARKMHGENFSGVGTIEPNSKGEFYFKPAPVKPAKAEKVLNNKSTILNPCKVVWDIAEQMAGARRKDIIAACEKAGIAFYTARTQYQKYTEAVRESIANAEANQTH